MRVIDGSPASSLLVPRCRACCHRGRAGPRQRSSCRRSPPGSAWNFTRMSYWFLLMSYTYIALTLLTHLLSVHVGYVVATAPEGFPHVQCWDNGASASLFKRDPAGCRLSPHRGLRRRH
jgi:hypothetical protein